MENVIKLLHLEDNPNDALLVQSLLKQRKINFEYYFADNEHDYISTLRNQKIDLILSDYHLPDYSGAEALLVVKDQYPEIPFVFLSGTMGEDAAIESLLNGATDYVLKNKMERLVPAVLKAYYGAIEKKGRRIADKELKKLFRAVEQSANSIIITDANGIIEYANPVVLKLTGYSNEELIGHNPRIFSSGEHSAEVYSNLWETISTGHDWKGEFHNKKKNGELYWESANISPIIDDNGIISNYVGIKEDITERKQLTSDLIKAKENAEESDRLKTAFLHNISHEIRTPMNAIIGFSELLNDPGLLYKKRKQFADIIVQSSNQLLSIISDIVDIATIESGQEKIYESEVNLNAALKLLHDQFIVKANKSKVLLNLELGLSDSEAAIFTDETKFVQIVTNLIGNALKFTKNGQVDIGYTIKGNVLEFHITDTGIGIPENMYDEIFNRFSQVESTVARQYGGSGLGLSISKAYVELMGGKMWLTSQLEKGSTFYFTIPFKKAPESTPVEKLSVERLGITIFQPKTVLIAEDENSNYLLLKEPLSETNITLIRAFNGAEAIEVCKSTHIDLVLMDIKMPVMDGYEAAKQIRMLKPDLPIIAQTAYSKDIDREKAFKSGCTDFVSKPINLEILVAKINDILNKA